MRRTLALVGLLLCLPGLAFAQNVTTNPGGLDPDSFGHSLTYLGLGISPMIYFDSACAPGEVTPPDQCVTVPADGSPVTFTFNDLGSMVIPAKSTMTTLWPMMISNISMVFQDGTGLGGRAKLNASVLITIESSVLLDPTILDPYSGLPANGKIVASFAAVYGMDRQLGPNEPYRLHLRSDASGINAFTTAVLGLTPKQTKELFKNPITLHWGLAGNVQNASGRFSVAFRIMGDK